MRIRLFTKWILISIHLTLPVILSKILPNHNTTSFIISHHTTRASDSISKRILPHSKSGTSRVCLLPRSSIDIKRICSFDLLNNKFSEFVGKCNDLFNTDVDTLMKYGTDYIKLFTRQIVHKMRLLYTLSFDIKSLLNFTSDPLFYINYINILCYLFDQYIMHGYLSSSLSLIGLNVYYKGEYYRLFTSLFLHEDIIHLLSNTASLINMGTEVFKQLGGRRLFLVYVFSGIIANYFSYIYNFGYKNGLPSNLLRLVNSIGKNITMVKKSVSAAYSDVIDDILTRSRNTPFLFYAIDYLSTNVESSYDYLITLIIQYLLNYRQKLFNVNENTIKNICISKVNHNFKACGASTSIYGLSGAMLLYNLKLQNYDRCREILKSVLISSIFKMFNNKVDHMGHMAGFVSGIITALIIS